MHPVADSAQPDADSVRLRVPERVRQSLLGDPVQVVRHAVVIKGELPVALEVAPYAGAAAYGLLGQILEGLDQAVGAGQDRA